MNFRRWLLAIATLVVALPAFGADKLVIISPHRKSIQEEFVPAFEAYYKKTYGTDVVVDWLDQGGSADDIRFVKAKFASNPKTSGIDIFWGGGTTTFLDLDDAKLLAAYTPAAAKDKELPATAAGIPLYNPEHTWHASALSSFGIFYNKKIFAFEKWPEPKKWEDLADPRFRGDISLTDPRRSGTANTMNTIILKSMGWEKGWELLTEIAGNTRSFTHSSTDPIKSVVSGDTAMAMAIDFYALAKIGDLGEDNLGFVMPEGQTVIDPDPIAVMKGAPNRKVAERFVDFVLSKDAQKLLVLSKGTPQGPTRSTLGRMAVNVKTYEETEGKRTTPINPFNQKSSLVYDTKEAAKQKRIFDDLVGAVLVDTHHQLKKSWARATKKGLTPEDLAKFGRMPVTEKEFGALTDKWGNDVFRNQTINQWVEFAKNKYQEVAAH